MLYSIIDLKHNVYLIKFDRLTILQFINDHQILKPDGLIVIEERYNITLPKKLSRLELSDKRKYGEACFSFYLAVDPEKSR